jgi:hypothetical protein
MQVFFYLSILHYTYLKARAILIGHIFIISRLSRTVDCVISTFTCCCIRLSVSIIGPNFIVSEG